MCGFSIDCSFSDSLAANFSSIYPLYLSRGGGFAFHLRCRQPPFSFQTVFSSTPTPRSSVPNWQPTVEKRGGARGACAANVLGKFWWRAPVSGPCAKLRDGRLRMKIFWEPCSARQSRVAPSYRLRLCSCASFACSCSSGAVRCSMTSYCS